MIKGRVSNLEQFFNSRATQADNGTTVPIPAYYLFRALRVNFMTAFAFSEADGTEFWGRLLDHMVWKVWTFS